MIATGAQLRAARALLGITRAQLAAHAGVHPNSVAYWEATEQIATNRFIEPWACERMNEALARLGVETFTTPTLGVRFRSMPTKSHAARSEGNGRPGTASTSSADV